VELTEIQFKQLYEQEFFTPCETKQDLKQWISTFLQIDFPDLIIDENSTSTPMDFIWEVYDTARLGKPTTHVGASARACQKTLSVSVLEFLMMIHFRKTIIHLAAIVDQSIAMIAYLNKYINNPLMQRYILANTNRKKELHNLPPNKYSKLTIASLKVIVATTESSNGMRGNCLFFDEVDLIDRAILSESAMIADPDMQGNPPIFVYISSRKSNFGPVQDKIDASYDPSNNIRLHKWSLVDFLRKCSDEVCQRDTPAVRYLHSDTLEVKDTEELLKLPKTQAELFSVIPCFQGCLTCKAFVICQGRAVKQTQSCLVLREQVFVASVVRETGDADKIKAQLLNLKPESAGSVFSRFNKELHFRSIHDCYEFAFNEPYDGHVELDKYEFVMLLREAGWYMTCGVDFGWTALSVALLTAYHRGMDKVLFLHMEYASGYPNADWLAFIKENIYDVYGFDLLCPDTADKSSPKMAYKLGMTSRTVKPLKIQTGIDWLRSKMWSPSKQASSLMILADNNTKLLAKALEEYQYRRTATGFVYNQYEDETVNSDIADGCRYAIDPFVHTSGVVLQASQPDVPMYHKGIEIAPNREDPLQPILNKDTVNQEIKAFYLSEYGIEITAPKKVDKNDNVRKSFSFSFD
jgi:hypothetical protein